MKIKLLLGIALVLIVSIALYFYTFQGHRTISSETAIYTVSVAELEKEFAENSTLAYNKYQDQTIKITATVTALDTENSSITLNNKVNATFRHRLPQNINLNKTLTIKGRFLGYDELLEEFRIDQCSISI